MDLLRSGNITGSAPKRELRLYPSAYSAGSSRVFLDNIHSDFCRIESDLTPE